MSRLVTQLLTHPPVTRAAPVTRAVTRMVHGELQVPHEAALDDGLALKVRPRAPARAGQHDRHVRERERGGGDFLRKGLLQLAILGHRGAATHAAQRPLARAVGVLQSGKNAHYVVRDVSGNEDRAAGCELWRE